MDFYNYNFICKLIKSGNFFHMNLIFNCLKYNHNKIMNFLFAFLCSQKLVSTNVLNNINKKKLFSRVLKKCFTIGIVSKIYDSYL